MSKPGKTTLAIYTAIIVYRLEHGYPPVMRDIRALAGLRSTSSVEYHLRKLRAQGLITWEPGKGRTIRTVT